MIKKSLWLLTRFTIIDSRELVQQGRYNLAPIPVTNPVEITGEVLVGEVVPPVDDGSVTRLQRHAELMFTAVTNWPAVVAEREAAAKQAEIDGVHEDTDRALAQAALSTAQLLADTDGLPTFRQLADDVEVDNPATVAVRAGVQKTQRIHELRGKIIGFELLLTTMPADHPERPDIQHGMEMTARLLGAELQDGTLEIERDQGPKIDILERVLAGLRRL